MIGGTGPEGIGLALRFAAAGEHRPHRLEVRGAGAAPRRTQVRERVPARVGRRRSSTRRPPREADLHRRDDPLRRAGVARWNRWATRIGGKIVIDAVVPLEVRQGPFIRRPAGRGGLGGTAGAGACCRETRVVAAFLEPERGASWLRSSQPLDGDVVVCGDDAGARRTAMTLADQRIPGRQGHRRRRPGERPPSGAGDGAPALTLNRIHKTHDQHQDHRYLSDSNRANAEFLRRPPARGPGDRNRGPAGSARRATTSALLAADGCGCAGHAVCKRTTCWSSRRRSFRRRKAGWWSCGPCEPSAMAREFAAALGQGRATGGGRAAGRHSRIVRMDRGVLIVETRHGFVCANAGVDASNTGRPGFVTLLPEDA